MQAFAVRVTNTNTLNYNTDEYMSRGELGVSATGRLVRIFSSAMLESKELAEKYSASIGERRKAKGDEDFESEIIEISMNDKGFPDRVRSDTNKVQIKLSKSKK